MERETYPYGTMLPLNLRLGLDSELDIKMIDLIVDSLISTETFELRTVL